MVPKTGSRLPKLPIWPSEAEFSDAIGIALRSELGASRRATKTIMAWANVSDRTARTWLGGLSSPGGLHIVALAARSRSVMTVVLKLAGHERVALTFELLAIEAALQAALAAVSELTGTGQA